MDILSDEESEKSEKPPVISREEALKKIKAGNLFLRPSQGKDTTVNVEPSLKNEATDSLSNPSRQKPEVVNSAVTKSPAKVEAALDDLDNFETSDSLKEGEDDVVEAAGINTDVEHEFVILNGKTIPLPSHLKEDFERSHVISPSIIESVATNVLAHSEKRIWGIKSLNDSVFDYLSEASEFLLLRTFSNLSPADRSKISKNDLINYMLYHRQLFAPSQDDEVDFYPECFSSKSDEAT